MNLEQYFTKEHLLLLVLPAAVFFITLAIGLTIRKIMFMRLAKWAEKTETEVDDVVIHSIRRPFLIWCVMISLYAALDASRLPDGAVHIAGKALLALGIISVTMALANIASGMVRIYSGRMNAGLATTSLTQNVTRIMVFGIGILVVLNSLGISITPILATLGVGGLAVALALQETLSNLFAGFHLTLAKQIGVGDYVKLESGQEGYVVDINWRTTKIRMLSNNVVLVPNSKLAQTVITNYYLPDKELAISVDLEVHYNSDLKKIESVTCEVAREVMKEVSGGVPSYQPSLRYTKFSDSGVSLSVGLKVKEFADQYLVKHEFIKRLHERYRKEGIVIPYPIRAINYSQEKAEVK